VRRLTALVAFSLLASACSSGARDVATEGSAVTATGGESTSPTSDAPTLPVDVQLAIDWFIEVLNGVDLTESEYEGRFTSVFKSQVGFEAFLEVLDGLRRRSPYMLVERGGSGAVGYAIVESETGEQYRVSGQLDGDGRFDGLLVSRESFAEMANPPASVGEAFDLLGQISPFAGIAAQISDGECSTIASIAADEAAPIGSVFKLYVLGTLARQIEEGEAAWDDELVITDDVKSIPTGTLQDRPAGSTVTVEEAAELMISISDNTAADLLIRYLGRETVESSLADLGMSDPSLNVPFLTTLEFAVLKLTVDDAIREAYIAGDGQARRDILAGISEVFVEEVPVVEFTRPVNPDGIEWFASPADLCRLAIELWNLSERPGLEPIDTILSLNPGVPDDDGRWSQIWFKGGSEPGLLAIWFAVESADGSRYVLAGSNVDPQSNIDSDRAVLVWSAGRDVLAQNAG
jgi:hypothetical protein